MMAALHISKYTKTLKNDKLIKETEELLVKIGLPVKIPKKLDINKIMKIMSSDKKFIQGKTRFVLIENLAITKIKNNIPDSIILKSLKQIN